MLREEVIVPLPSPRSLAPRTTQVRGSWLLSSLRALREAGVFDRYMAELPAALHETMRAPPAREWLPVEVALEHYAACDRLNLPPNQIVEMGAQATKYGQSASMGVAAKLAVGVGATPWTIFAQAQRFWERAWVGGAMGVTKLGPKEARIELVGWTCAGFRYTRIACRGVIQATCETFGSKGYAREIEALCTPLSVGYRVGWI